MLENSAALNMGFDSHAKITANLISLDIHCGLLGLDPAVGGDLFNDVQQADIIVGHPGYLNGVLQCILRYGSEIPRNYYYLAVNFHILKLISSET